MASSQQSMASRSAVPDALRSLWRTARGACRLLSRESEHQIADFVLSQLAADGGFRGRGAAGDLYYTLFGVECLAALGRPLPAGTIRRFLAGFGRGDDLDLVHLCCLVRCLARLADTAERRRQVAGAAQLLHRFKVPGEGFALGQGGQSSIYGSFLAVLALAAADLPLADPQDLERGTASLRCHDGSYGDRPALACGTTTVTAAAIVLLAQLGRPVPSAATDWLLEQGTASGGFVATPGAPVPDLLSTATARFALQCAGLPAVRDQEAVLDFLQSVWSDGGGFSGHVLDSATDCEYTFYGLLCLGTLGAGE
jgi:prenyltransferase beta subunit